MIRYITVYEVDRCYGGPEEGGWWYNRYVPIETITLPKAYQRKSKRAVKKVNALSKTLEVKYKDREWGNIYHSTGGLLIEAIIEVSRRENETKSKPFYC